MSRVHPDVPASDLPAVRGPLASRRSVLLGAAAGLAGVAVGVGPAQAAPVYTPIPKLPGEVSRSDTRTTRIGKKQYEAIEVVWGKDRARLYVPWATPPKAPKPGGVAWLYHSNGSTHTALDGAYAYPAMMLVDRGMVCVCPNFGGSTWTTQTALTHQVNWDKYISGVFNVGVAFARANSGGGSLMTYAYAKNMVRGMRGIYLANASYDMEDLYARDPGRIGPPYGNDPALVAATNPARMPQSAWAGKRVKTVVSLVDPLLPPDRHGLALAALAQPVAADVRIQYHDQGHTVPGWTHSDMVSTFSSWL
ncbi:hypothetical protein [Modestobacter sp. VKM Ac-2985]|uniref:hypothetical protein n=1 Tax=Modestobacter sp. VKM Ac-2985 TaxID=3004139 RepID=UPI0022AB7832|nr:hypothetical protein [Modestobacter sp. VKM Ac-2985]MCZ2836015.1 hypothetical protein [Modestobacter sp. VKM Ac-2985]